MCKYLDSACFLTNVFAVCESESSMDFAKLREVRDHVTHRLEAQNVVIEWTRTSVMGALESYSNLFDTRGNEVVWRGSKDREDVKRSFDARFSESFVGALRDAILEGCCESEESGFCHA